MLDWGEEGHRTEAEIASLRAAFKQEVAVWHKLEHPNVTKVTTTSLCICLLAVILKHEMDVLLDAPSNPQLYFLDLLTLSQLNAILIIVRLLEDADIIDNRGSIRPRMINDPITRNCSFFLLTFPSFYLFLS